MHIHIIIISTSRTKTISRNQERTGLRRMPGLKSLVVKSLVLKRNLVSPWSSNII